MAAATTLEKNIIKLAQCELEELRMLKEDTSRIGRESAANAFARGMSYCDIAICGEHGLTEKGAAELQELNKKFIDALAPKYESASSPVETNALGLENSLIRSAEDALYALKLFLEIDSDHARNVSKIQFLKGTAHCEHAFFDSSELSEKGVAKLRSLYSQFEKLMPGETYEKTKNSR